MALVAGQFTKTRIMQRNNPPSGYAGQNPWMGALWIVEQKQAAWAVDGDAIDGPCQRPDAHDPGIATATRTCSEHPLWQVALLARRAFHSFPFSRPALPGVF